MNKIVLDYIRKFYNRANGEISYAYERNSPAKLSIDMFFENWTTNFHNNFTSEYRLWDGSKIDKHELLFLVHEDSKKGFFERKMAQESVHYRMTELGKQYVLLKLEL